MRLLPFRAPLLALLLPHALGSLEPDCASQDERTQPECSRPMKPVTTVTPSAYYIAKIPCPDCKVQEFHGERENRTYDLVERDNDLVSGAIPLGGIYI